MDLKSGLENRLILSAEVGQALLQRHEAYLRSHKKCPHISLSGSAGLDEDVYEVPVPDNPGWLKEKALLEKRLNQALANNEATETSNKTISHELEEARSTISRLKVQQARSAGWETRLAVTIQEKEDMQQERDGEAARAKLAESRLKALKDKSAKLQNEVRRLQDTLTERSSQHLESSEHMIQDTRSRIEALHNSLGKIQNGEQREIMAILESLVKDNEMLKQDNAELQIMLADSREEIRGLKEENEEYQARPPSPRRVSTPFTRERLFAGSVPSSLGRDTSAHLFHSRSVSAERERRFQFPFETPTIGSGRLPLSLADSLPQSEAQGSHSGRHQVYSPASEFSLESDHISIFHSEEIRSLHKSQSHFLMHSRGVQTDAWFCDNLCTNHPLHSFYPASFKGPRSESSSFSDAPSSNMTSLLERIHSLFHRLVQADALTLRNRLKRQHLQGADVAHLSRTTVKNIISDLVILQSQFRHLLEDDSLVTSCMRKDFRLLFRLLKDVLLEFGELRIVLNDVILDPSTATKVSDLALHPNSQATKEGRTVEGDRSNNTAFTVGWMAPISKLFSPSAQPVGRTPGHNHSVNSRTSRTVPKLEPKLSASAMTVNVEFSGTAVGRSTTSTVTQLAGKTVEASKPPLAPGNQNGISTVNDIFVGAPRDPSPDPWVVIPKIPRRVDQSIYSGTLSRGPGASPVSRQVNAVLDLPSPTCHEEFDELGPLPDHPLRRRGLSDSSIHSTFTNQASPESQPIIVVNAPPTDDQHPPAWPEARSVLHSFSKTMQNFGMTVSGTSEATDTQTWDGTKTDNSVTLRRQPSSLVDPVDKPIKAVGRQDNSPSGLRNLLPLTMSSWAASGSFLKPTGIEDGLLAGSLRDESFMPRKRQPMMNSRGRDPF